MKLYKYTEFTLSFSETMIMYSTSYICVLQPDFNYLQTIGTFKIAVLCDEHAGKKKNWSRFIVRRDISRSVIGCSPIIIFLRWPVPNMVKYFLYMKFSGIV